MSYVAVLAGFGLLVLLSAWLPMILKEAPLSLPIVAMAIGAGLWLLPIPLPALDPRDHPAVTERVTEFVVVIALMGAGLKLDRPLGWRSWRTTWRLLGVAMPLTIAAFTVTGWWLLGLGLPTALLLAALLSPTDPVLASEMQVGPPQKGGEDETRFALTSEAGLNDGLAFPFVLLALALAAAGGSNPASVLPGWLGVAVIWKIGAGLAVGLAAGHGLGWLVFHMPNRASLSRTGDGFVALGATTLVYGATELVAGYGFVAVFVAALALRASERDHSFHGKLHDFAEQLERLAMTVLLLLFGWALMSGHLLAAIDWRVVAYVAVGFVLIRPLAASLSLIGCRMPASETATISVFGIRGLGSFYYLAFALHHGPETGAAFERPDLLWTVTAVTVASSILVHGASSAPVLRWLDRRTGRHPGDQLDLPLSGEDRLPRNLAALGIAAPPDPPPAKSEPSAAGEPSRAG